MWGEEPALHKSPGGGRRIFLWGPGGLFGSLWRPLVGSWLVLWPLGALLARLGALLAAFEPLLARLGALLAVFGPLLARHGALLGRS